jgi:glucan-binding YG repeat protein
MPLEYFGDYTAWSFSAGSLIRGDVDASSVKVTLTRTSDKKTWTFSKASSNGYFNVDNGSYGSGSCIIFRPDNITYKAGDKFDVTISGVTEEDIKYSVSFFNLSGWKKQTNGTWQYQINGVAQTGWDEIDYKWYHFTSTGIMDSGWKKLSNSWYYFGGANDGVMKTGWQKISGKWYYFGYENDGRMKTGWQTIGGKRYYFGGANDGAMKSGWQTIGGKRYYFGGANDGKLRA